MPIFTMGIGSPCRHYLREKAPPYIFGVGDQIQVDRIDARMDAAKMINF